MEIPAYIASQFQKPEGAPGVNPASTGAPIAAGLKDLAGAFAEADIENERMVGNAARLGEFVARKGLLTDRLGALDDSLSKDPDHRTYFDRAKKGIEQAATDVLSGINDPALKNALTSHVSDVKERFLVDARHKARVLTIDFTRRELERDIDRNIGEATSTSDAKVLLQAEGNIASAVNGAVTGGIWTAEHGGKVARAAREKIHTTLAEQMADKEPGRFLSNYKEGLYKDTVDPLKLEGIRRYAENRNQAVDAAVASTAVWEEMGPKRDEDPINEDLMVRALEVKFAGEPDKSKLAIASLKEKVQAHDKGSKERKDANLSAVWKASLAGQSLPSILAMPEYSALDGGTQRQVKEHLEDRSWMLQRRSEEDPGRKAAQHELYWRYSQPAVLVGMSENNISALYPSLGVPLTDKLMENRRALDNPVKAAEAKIDQDDFNHFARVAGIVPEEKKNRAALGEIKFSVENAIDAEQRSKGRILTREEKAKIMKTGLAEVDVRTSIGFLGVDLGTSIRKKRFFDVQYPGNIVIPDADKAKIANDLTVRGIPATEENVRAMYIQLQVK